MLSDLGIAKTQSRSQVSNDNPFSEAQFKAMKYRPGFPDWYGCIEDGRAFCVNFSGWNNNDHYQSRLALLTPRTVHYGETETVLGGRREILEMACAQHLERFVRRVPVPAEPPKEVWINPLKAVDADGELQ